MFSMERPQQTKRPMRRSDQIRTTLALFLFNSACTFPACPWIFFNVEAARANSLNCAFDFPFRPNIPCDTKVHESTKRNDAVVGVLKGSEHGSGCSQAYLDFVNLLAMAVEQLL